VAGSDRTTDGDLGVLLTHARQAADWAADIEERAQKVMSLGGRIDGFKLVEGTTRRKWREDAVATLKELGLDDLFEESLIPIGQAENCLVVIARA